MERVQISNDVSLSRIAQGFRRLSSWNLPTDELVNFMNACIDRGVTTFDTAEVYAGTLSESLMGQAFAADPSIRPRIQLVTKTGIFKDQGFGYYDTSYERILRSCRESLQRLNTDYLDLYLIHREDPLFDPWGTAKALLELKEQGLIREFGVSNFDPFKFEALQKATGYQLVTNQIEWSPVCFEHFNSGMMDYLTANRIHPMIWSPLGEGKLFQAGDPRCEAAMSVISQLAKKYDIEPSVMIFAWILHHPVGAVPLVGSRRLDRLDLAIHGLDVPLERSDWYRIYTASGQQKLR